MIYTPKVFDFWGVYRSNVDLFDFLCLVHHQLCKDAVGARGNAAATDNTNSEFSVHIFSSFGMQ